MPKSKLRGGAKAHKKRVKSRNHRVESDQNRVKNYFQKELDAEMEKMKDAQTDIVEVEDTDSGIEKEGV